MIWNSNKNILKRNWCNHDLRQRLMWRKHDQEKTHWSTSTLIVFIYISIYELRWIAKSILCFVWCPRDECIHKPYNVAQIIQRCVQIRLLLFAMLIQCPVNSLPTPYGDKILITSGSCNGLFPDRTKTLSEPMLTQCYLHQSQCNFTENGHDMLAKFII